jgi:DNA-binding GntR family transcriptional regulator
MPQTVKELAKAWGVSRDTISRAIKRIIPHEGILQSGEKKRGMRVYISYRILDSALPAIREAMKKGRDTSHDGPRKEQSKAQRSKEVFGIPASIDPDASFMDSTYYEAGIVLNGVDPYEK